MARATRYISLILNPKDMTRLCWRLERSQGREYGMMSGVVDKVECPNGVPT